MEEKKSTETRKSLGTVGFLSKFNLRVLELPLYFLTTRSHTRQGSCKSDSPMCDPDQRHPSHTNDETPVSHVGDLSPDHHRH